MQVNSRATRLLFEGTRCVGVDYIRDGKTQTARATSEVVVSAGAIESPKLLNLSGIGNAEHLTSLAIPVLVDLPGVGENFQDHPLVIGPIGRMDQPGADPKGQMTEASLFWRSDAGQPVPDIEVSLVHRAPFGENFFKNVVARIQTGETGRAGGRPGRPQRDPVAALPHPADCRAGRCASRAPIPPCRQT